MTTYTVHVYREMRIVFTGIAATSIEDAAEIAMELPSDSAESFEDCEGMTLSAVVDVDGDPDRSRSRFFHGDEGRLLDAAPQMLMALGQAVAALNTAPRFRVPSLGTDSYQIAALCERTIAKAKGEAR